MQTEIERRSFRSGNPCRFTPCLGPAGAKTGDPWTQDPGSFNSMSPGRAYACRAGNSPDHVSRKLRPRARIEATGVEHCELGGTRVTCLYRRRRGLSAPEENPIALRARGRAGARVRFVLVFASLWNCKSWCQPGDVSGQPLNPPRRRAFLPNLVRSSSTA